MSTAAHHAVHASVLPRHMPPPAQYGSEPLNVPRKPLPVGYQMRTSRQGVTVTNEKNEVVGRMTCDSEAPPGSWTVKSIFVFPHVRGAGIATAMIRGFADQCRLPFVYPTEPVTDEGSALFDSFHPLTTTRTP